MQAAASAEQIWQSKLDTAAQAAAQQADAKLSEAKQKSEQIYRAKLEVAAQDADKKLSQAQQQHDASLATVMAGTADLKQALSEAQSQVRDLEHSHPADMERLLKQLDSSATKNASLEAQLQVIFFENVDQLCLNWHNQRLHLSTLMDL